MGPLIKDGKPAVGLFRIIEAFSEGIPWEEIGGPLARSATFIEVTEEAADEAARISFGTGMPALDALILAGLLKAGCRTIYTRDEHFTRYARKGVEIILLD
ncbi:MAG: PIN domain-containing protein [Candidatus Aminicenantes bacterium]|nr:PIN domain-containing protein [Candidatus Aminicenantes bacterium]